MNLSVVAILVAAFSQLGAEAPAAPSPSPGGEPTLRPAAITAENDVVIAAEAEGTLIKLPVREGAQLAVGDLLAIIDDRQAQAAREVARIGHEAALARADDAVEETFAIASAAFAKVDLEKDLSLIHI